MNRYLSGWLLAAAAVGLASACVKDPTASIRTNAPARITPSNRFLTLNVGDSVRVSVTATDEQGNVLADAVTATSLDQATVAAGVAPASLPLPQTNFFIKATGFGAGRVEVALGALRDTIRVNTLPATLRIAGQTDTLLLSGTSVQLTAEPLGADGAVVAGVTPIAWATSDATVATVDASGLVTGRAVGLVEITLTVPGGTTKVTFQVVPAAFTGTLSATSGNPGELITITRAPGGPAMDADTRVTFRGRQTFVHSFTADNIVVPVPPVEVAGPVELVVIDMGPNQIAQGVTFTSNTAGYADQYEPANDDPFTAPAVTNGDYYMVLHGECIDPPPTPPFDFGTPQNPGDECDDFFSITNSSAAAADVTIALQWLDATGPGTADIDLIITDANVTTIIDAPFAATNPETVTVSIPAGETYRIWANVYDWHDNPYSLARVRVSGLP